MNDYWAVRYDGRLVERALPRAQADAFANKMANGLLAKRGSDAKRVPEIEVVRDTEYIDSLEVSRKLVKGL